MKTALTAWHRVGNLVRLMPPAKVEKVRAAWRQKFRRVCRPRRLIRMALRGETAVSSVSGAGLGRGAGAGAGRPLLHRPRSVLPGPGPGWRPRVDRDRLGTAR